MEAEELYPSRALPTRRAVNFVIGSKPVDDLGRKAILVEIDPEHQLRVGDLLEATDSRTRRRYAFQVYDIEPAYSHGEQHAEMLDHLRRRPDKQFDDSSYFSVCKNMAVCALLGEMEGGSFTDTGYRPNKYTTTCVEAGTDIESMMVAGWQDGAPIGHLRMGREVRLEHPIHFSTLPLVGKRFAIFAQTGGGKSTAMRQLLDWHTRQMDQADAHPKIGFLVDDFKLEYPFDIKNERDDTVPGIVTKLGDVARHKIVILTTRPNDFGEQKNLVRDVLTAKIPLDSVALSVFAELADLSDAQERVLRLIEDSGKTTPEQFFRDLFSTDSYGMPDNAVWTRKYGPTFYSDAAKKKLKAGAALNDNDEENLHGNLRDRLEYVRWKAKRLCSPPFMARNSAAGNCLPKLMQYLSEGCTVIIDKGNLEDHEREQLTVLLLYHLFRHNQDAMRGGANNSKEAIPAVYAVEEAHYLLSEDKVADPDSIFAKIAFTGRSYKLGLLAITQRPQGIQKELLGQFDGFLVLPLEHANDFKHLADAAPALAQSRNDLANSSVGGGILAYGTPKSTVPVQITNYTWP